MSNTEVTTRRRVKLLYIPAELLINILLGQTGLVRAISFQDLPGDIVIEALQNDSLSRSFVLVVSHPSFDEIPPSCIPPTVTSSISAVPAVSLATLNEVTRPFRTHLFPEGKARFITPDSYDAGSLAVLEAIHELVNPSATPS